jgi:hypothetical protein
LAFVGILAAYMAFERTFDSRRNPSEVESDVVSILQEQGAHKRSVCSSLAEVAKSYGWETLFRVVCNRKGDIIVSDSAPILVCIESARLFASPRTFPLSEVRRCEQYTETSLEWLAFTEYVRMRERVEAIDVSDVYELIRVPSDPPLRIWNEDGARELAAKIMQEMPELAEMLPEHPTGVGSWGDVFLRHDSVYAWNVVLAGRDKTLDFYRDDPSVQRSIIARVENVLLPEAELREMLRVRIQTDDAVFQYVCNNEMLCAAYEYSAEEWVDRYRLDDSIANMHRDNGDVVDVATYASYMFARPVSRDMLALFHPDGRMGDVVSLKTDRVRVESAVCQGWTWSMVQRARSYFEDDRVSEEQGTLVALAVFWDIFPQHIRDYVTNFYHTYHVDFHLHATMMRHAFFEEIVQGLKRFSNIVPADLVSIVRAHLVIIEGELEKGRENALMVTPEQITSDANVVYGVEGVHTEEALALLKGLRIETLKRIEQDIGVSLQDVSTREVLSLLHFLHHHEGGDGFAQVRTFIGGAVDINGRQSRIRTFLSVERDTRRGERILSMPERIGEKAVDAVCAAYARLVLAKEDMGQYLQEVYSVDSLSSDVLVQRILKRAMVDAHALLLRAAEESNVSTVSNILSRFETDVRLLNDAYINIRHESPDVTIEDLSGVKFRREKLSGIEPAMFQDIENIYKENWEEAGQVFVEEKTRALRSAAETNAEAYIVTYERGGEVYVLAFALLHEVDGKTVFVSGLNRNKNITEGDVGRLVLERIISEVGEKRVLKADIVLHSALQRVYIEKYDCVGVGIDTVAGVVLLDVVRDPVYIAGLVSRQWSSFSEVEAALGSGKYAQQCVLYEGIDPDMYTQYFEAGYVVARVFSHKRVLFEKPHNT